MKEYAEFVAQLNSFLESYKLTPSDSWKVKAVKFVDGLAAEELRRLVALNVRRDYGAFFTDSKLASQILRTLGKKLTKDSKIYDPACGAGNLLVAVASSVHKSNVKLNIESKLYGTDIHKEFVEAARLRLKINRLLHGHSDSNLDTRLISQICTKDGLLENNFYKNATHIIVNPPFNLIESNEDLEWGQGMVSSAALFIDKIMSNVNPGVTITALLPDVLRSGSRYEKWRSLVAKQCSVENVTLLGQFDRYADVDVFCLELLKRKQTLSTPTPNSLLNKKVRSKEKRIIESLFEVCVGPVVDNRDPIKGQDLGYLVSRGLKDWSEIKKLQRRRRHQGKSFGGPFVVIKRTSRLGDQHRAAATIINTSKPVYVDNHLIILKPKSGKLTDCRSVLKTLRDVKTNNWLNKQIRCRHLTVKIVSKIPL